MRLWKRVLRAAVLTGCLTVVRAAEEAAPAPGLALGSPFVDHAVLQRGMETPVWGWAAPGSRVTVEFAGQSISTAADRDGKWMVRLGALNASAAGQELSVRSSAAGDQPPRSLSISDVLVGEVWFASGQSNMDWVAGKSMCRDLANSLQRSQEEIPIREYEVDIGSALFPQSRTTSEGGWKRAPAAGGFSALALAFAWSLHEQLKVPIGILRSTHGATQIETWTAYEGFAAHPQLQDIALKIRQSDPSTPEGKAAYAAFYGELRAWQVASERLMNRGGGALPRPSLPGIASEWRGPTRMYNMKVAPLIPYAIRGVIWCQGTHNAGDGRIYAAKMEALLNGWRKNWGRPDLPFYFTQMQCYGDRNPDAVGFADIREAQRLFFMNATNVGMVLQYDLNPARPTGIHYTNKLDPGKRLARWALAHEYGRDIAYTGPIYKAHTIRGRTVRVLFEQRGPGGGLMVGSKGMEGAADFVEPARETPGEKLRHFRLAGKDRVWRDADARIDGMAVVVTSEAVPEPVGVQYAYSASPIGANLYNRAGLPATPFAYFEGKQLFNEDLPAVIAAAKAQEEAKANPPPRTPYVQLCSIYRNRAVVQRDLPVPVWGFALPDTEVTVCFGGQTKTARADEFDRWSVKLDPMPAAARGQDMTVTCSNGPTATVKDIVVGDVWVLTGAAALSSELVLSRGNTTAPPAMLLLREFRIKTKARRFRTPRKRRMEVGGGKYVSAWRPAAFAEPDNDTSVAAYEFASRVREEGVPVGIINTGADNPPLTWLSYAGLQTAVGFEKERDELNLLYPNTKVCKAAVETYIETVTQYSRQIAALRAAGKEIPPALAKQAPAFPEPYYNQWSNETETATHTYNFCVCPLTPFAVRGVVWVPGPKNIGEDVARYALALEAYAESLPQTYGQDRAAFVFAQPTAELVAGIATPHIGNAVSVEFGEWSKSLKELIARLGAAAADGMK